MEDTQSEKSNTPHITAVIVERDPVLARNMADLLHLQATKYNFSIGVWLGDTLIDALMLIDQYHPRLISTEMDFPMEDGGVAVKRNGAILLKSLRARGTMTPVLINSEYAPGKASVGLRSLISECDVFDRRLIMPWADRAMQILHPPTLEVIRINRPKPNIRTSLY